MDVRGFAVRDGRAGDIESCLSLALMSAPDSDASIWRTTFRDDINNADRVLVVAEHVGELVAYARAMRFEPEADAPADIAPPGYYLMGLIVHPDHRRLGIASALTQARLDWISGRADEAWYFANARNEASIALHSAFAFEEVTRSFFYPRVDFDREEGVLFRVRFRSA